MKNRRRVLHPFVPTTSSQLWLTIQSSGYGGPWESQQEGIPPRLGPELVGCEREHSAQVLLASVLRNRTLVFGKCRALNGQFVVSGRIFLTTFAILLSTVRSCFAASRSPLAYSGPPAFRFFSLW